MAQENKILDYNAGIDGSCVSRQTCDVTIIYGSNDPDKGIRIMPDTVTELIIRENFFLLLPTMKLRLFDIGSIFHDINFQIGYSFYVKIEPVLTDSDMVPSKPLFEGVFNIQSIENYNDFDRDTYSYVFNCMYQADKFINDICIWPKTDTMAGKIPSLDKSYTSKDTLSVVLANAGLKPTTDFINDPDDNMSWLNSTLTYAEFTKKIVRHAWIKKDDMPLFYIDRNGYAYYTSLNTLCDKTTTGQYIHQTRYQKLYDPKDENTSDSAEKPIVYNVYNNLEFANYGYLQNNGGYNVKKYIFNPYNSLEINPTEICPVSFDITNPRAITLNDTCFRSVEFKDKGKDGNGALRVGNISNRAPTQGETVRYHSVSMHFKQNHQYYDYAPIHHEAVKHAFFQQFAFMTISVTDQPGYAEDPAILLKLGDKIKIDTSTLAHDTSIQTNNFIVTGLTHHIAFGTKYTIMATCVSDGIGGIGYLEKQSENTQKVT